MKKVLVGLLIALAACSSTVAEPFWPHITELFAKHDAQQAEIDALRIDLDAKDALVLELETLVRGYEDRIITLEKANEHDDSVLQPVAMMIFPTPSKVKMWIAPIEAGMGNDVPWPEKFRDEKVIRISFETNKLDGQRRIKYTHSPDFTVTYQPIPGEFKRAMLWVSSPITGAAKGGWDDNPLEYAKR